MTAACNPLAAEQADSAAAPVGAEHFAAFLAGIGHRVVRTESAYWYDASWGFFLSMPSHHLLVPTAAELRSVLRRQPSLGVRFPAPLEGPGTLSYQIICDAPDYGLAQLSANTRSKVRRGLRRCTVRPVSFAEIAASGVDADRTTLSRQGRPPRLRGARWARYWTAAAATPGMEGWGAFVGHHLAAFLVTVQFGEGVEFLLARSRSDLLDAYPNNALIFSVAEELLGHRGVREITFGLESLEPVGPLDQFKFGMGFRPRPLRQRVVFHPAIRWAVQSPAVRALLLRRGGRPGEAAMFWRKAAGLVRLAEGDR